MALSTNQDWWTTNSPPLTAGVNPFAPGGPVSTGFDLAGIGPTGWQGGGQPTVNSNPTGNVAVPGDTGATGLTGSPTPPPTTTTGLSWIDDALKQAQSTDDVSQWYKYVQADPKAMAGDPSAVAYWKDRIARGDGALAVRNGTVQKFQDGSAASGNQYANFGVPDQPYASNPNAPTYTAPTTPTALSTPFTPATYTAPTFEQPTVAEVEARPGYQIGLDTGLQQINRSAAARGTVLNPGTVQALNRYGTDYAGTQYGNVLGQDLSIFNVNAGNAFNAASFNASQALAARSQNENEFQQNVVAPTQTSFQNKYASYLNDNARTLNDYLTNYNIQHAGATDMWANTQQVANRGAQAAGNAGPA